MRFESEKLDPAKHKYLGIREGAVFIIGAKDQKRFIVSWERGHNASSEPYRQTYGSRETYKENPRTGGFPGREQSLNLSGSFL